MEILKKKIQEMTDDVKIIMYTGENCELCGPTEELLKILADLSGGKINLEIMQMENMEEVKKKLGVERPPIILMGERREVRYTGAPLGHEGWALLETIVALSTKKTQIPENYIEKLKNLKRPVRIETIITPTCPYCPYAVLIANSIAIASEGKVISDAIEAHEFPEIAEKFNVMAVPTVVLSTKPYQGEVFSVGVPKEEQLMEKIIEIGMSST